ncbi:carbohydrate kinase family protein [Cohaesibacter intestini]|uniref:carbohydrate kinase family protein n=1 Tax=Cohaesibacter intestini TaxID=2211145 RepID=UPI000DE9985E|nr:carbohydrate kinase family protein [Cohaesibacter intestini]
MQVTFSPDNHPDILVVGGAHMDRIGRSRARLELGQSNPGSLKRTVGGVAGNITRSLARLDWKVALSTISGEDIDATLLLEQLQQQGIDMSLATRNPDLPSATYTAIEDRDGSLIAGIADMGIYDSYPADQITHALSRLTKPTRILADTNLPTDALLRIAEAKGDHLFAVCAVSGPKANRVAEALHGVDLLFCNEAEAAILADEFADLAALPDILRDIGVTSGVITKGNAGVTAWQGDKVWSLPAPPVKVTSSNGAGDCLTACTLHALLLGRDLQQALAYGMAGASLALMSEQSVPDLLSRTMLEACLADIPASQPQS